MTALNRGCSRPPTRRATTPRSAAPAAFTDATARQPDPFFGGQIAADVFGESEKGLQPGYFSPFDIDISNYFTDELVNVASAGTDGQQAWRDARFAIDGLPQRSGALC